MRKWSLFLFLLLFRLANVFFVQTAFVPDEFWQSIEVAHNWAFGYGAITWEWDSAIALRSPIHPLLFTFLYRCLSWMSLDCKRSILLAPRILHAVLVAVTDLHVYKLAYGLSGPSVASWTLFHQLINWFTFFCAPRTLSNNLEWSLTIIALSHYPWKMLDTFSASGHPAYIVLAVLCVLIRPTAGVMWLPLCLLHLSFTWLSTRWTEEKAYSRRNSRKENPVVKLCTHYLVTGFALLSFSLLLDRWAFGRWTMNQWNFLRFNLLAGGSHFYGTHPWHWYLSQGLPVILLSQLPLFLFGFSSVLLRGSGLLQQSHIRPRPASYVLCGVCIWTVFCYSFLSHKEFRFVFPLVPILFYFCAIGTQWILTLRPIRPWWVILFLVCSQTSVALYTTMFHQRGTLDALDAIHRTVEKQQGVSSRNIHVLTLMPCHSVPSIGFLHTNITFRQLSCDPNLTHMTAKHGEWEDEADRFYTNPSDWLMEHYPGRGSVAKPHFILAFDHLYRNYPEVLNLFQTVWRFTLCGQYFHTHFPTHSRHGNYVHVWCHPAIKL